MIRIIDATLTKVDDCLPTKDQLLLFCQKMKEIGIEDLEISTQVYHVLEELPEGVRFYLHVDYLLPQERYRNIYKYITHHGQNHETVISEYQINDVRELVQLKRLAEKQQLSLVGFDDLICHDYETIMCEIRKTLSKSRILFCPENTYGLATAIAVQWILLGGEEVSTTFAGYGGRAATEEVLVALRVIKRYKPNQNIASLLEITSLFEEITHTKIRGCKPIIGRDIFTVESGIHVDGIIKNPSNYEAFDPKMVGQTTRIMLGKHSGSNSVKLKLAQYDIPLPNAPQLNQILYEIKHRSMVNRDSISDEEFLQIVKEVDADERKTLYR